MIITLDEYWLTFCISVVLPALVALITRQWASGSIKSVTLLFLSVVTGAATTIQASHGTFDLKATVTGIIVSFITAVVSHYGLLKPTGISGNSGIVARKAPSGIGRGRHRADT